MNERIFKHFIDVPARHFALHNFRILTGTTPYSSETYSVTHVAVAVKNMVSKVPYWETAWLCCDCGEPAIDCVDAGGQVEFQCVHDYVPKYKKHVNRWDYGELLVILIHNSI